MLLQLHANLGIFLVISCGGFSHSACWTCSSVWVDVMKPQRVSAPTHPAGTQHSDGMRSFITTVVILAA